MNTTSKLFALAMAAFMLVGAFVIVADEGGSDAAAGETFTVDGYTYTILTENETTGTVSIAAETPASYAGPLDLSEKTTVMYNEHTYTITAITAHGFMYSTLESITLNENIVSIGEFAFSRCEALKSVDLSNVTSIGNFAFNKCGALKSVDLSNVTSIGNSAFKLCGLTSVSFPATVAEPGTSIFQECASLASVTWGPTKIPDSTFYGCTNLSECNISHITTIGKSGFSGCEALKSVDLSNVTSIGKSAFKGTGFESVTVPATATVDTYIFQDCASLASVTWGPTAIPECEFFNCTALTGFDFSNITEIGSYAFRGCPLTSVIFPKEITIAENAFVKTQIRSITFEKTTNSIANLNAFPEAEYVYSNGAILDSWSPALTTAPAGEYVATYKQQADSWTTEPSIAAEFTYKDSITYTEGVAASGNAVTYTYVGRGATVYTESATVPTDAGTYALHAATAESDEYKSLSSYYNFTIIPATNIWTTDFAMDTTSFTYPDTVTYTPGEATYGEVHYVITDANNNALNVWPTDVGTYSVYAVVDGTVNYNGLSTEENAITFTIALPTGDDVATLSTAEGGIATIAAAQKAGDKTFIIPADFELVEDVVLGDGESIIMISGASFTGSITYTDSSDNVSILRAIDLVAGSTNLIAPGSIELSGTIAADYLVLSGAIVVTADTVISAGTMIVISDDAVISNQGDATLTIEAGAYYYNKGTLPTDAWFVNNGTAVAADYIGDNEVVVSMNTAGDIYLTLEIEGAYVGQVTTDNHIRVSWTVTDSEDAAIEYSGQVAYAHDADTFGVLVGDLTPGDYTISMYMYYVYESEQIVKSISVDKPFTVLPQDVIIGAYYSYSAYHAVLYNVFGNNLDPGMIYVDAFTAQTGELSDGTEYSYIGITTTLNAAVDGTSAGGSYDLDGTVDIDNMVALQPYYQITGSTTKLYAFETLAYTAKPVEISGVKAYSDLTAIVSIAYDEVDGGVWVYAVDALDGAILSAVVDDQNIYVATVTLGAGEFAFFDLETDFYTNSDTPSQTDISGEDVAYYFLTALTIDGTTVTDAHLSLVVLDYQ